MKLKFIVDQLSKPIKNLSVEERIQQLFSELIVGSNYKVKRLTINGIGGSNCDKITTTKKKIRERLSKIEDILGDEYSLEDVAWKLENFDDLILEFAKEIQYKNEIIQSLDTRIIEPSVMEQERMQLLYNSNRSY